MRGEKATLGWPFSLALNRMLEAMPGAHERLAAFAGATLELRAPPLPALSFAILPGGKLEALASRGDAAPTLVVTLKPDFLAALPRGEDHLLRAVEASGDPALAAEVMALARQLRAEAPEIAEENLSRVVGDVAARRLAQGAGDFLAWQADAARRLAGSFADYFTEEKRMVVGRAEHAAFAAAVSGLRDALERLEKRTGRLG